MKQFFYLFLICFCITSCSKKSAEKDQETPAIAITSPTDSEVFTAGQTIHITGTVSDNQFINQLHIEVNDLTTGEEYLHVHIHPNNKSYAFDQMLMAKAGTSYQIKLIAEDPSTNISSKQVVVSCN